MQQTVADQKHRGRLRQQLRLHRLDRGLSFERLRDDIHAATGVRLSPPTLMRFLNAERKTNEINLHAIKRYLAAFRRVRL
jgi:hypothetical protein